MNVFNGWLLLAAAWSAAGSEQTGAEKGPSREIPIESAVVTLIEQVEVPAQEAGVISEVRTREGRLVTKGELLAQIDDAQAQMTKKRAQIELDNALHQSENRIGIRFAEKSREVAEAELKRATDSLSRYPKSISATEIDRLRLSAEKAALAVEQATFEYGVVQFSRKLREADVELATHGVLRRKVTAPIPGIVVEVNRREGEWVEPSETVFRILRIDRLRAEGFLHASHLHEELVGRNVKLSTTLPGGKKAEFSGKLVFVSPEVSPVNGQARVWAEIENRDLLLRPGLRGSMIIEVP